MSSQVLLLSQRNISRLVAYCLSYEFEDVISLVTDAVRIDIQDNAPIEFSRRAYKAVRWASGSAHFAKLIAPAPRSKVLLDRDFEFFFPIFSNAFQLYSLAAVPEWRKRSHKAACFITEVWSDILPEYLIELMRGFDHIFLGLRHSVSEIARITGRPCSYLPLAADVLTFAPATLSQPRPIEVCNLGRRSRVTHKALVSYAKSQGVFYYYDTVQASGSDQRDRTFRVDNPAEHRFMIANLIKRSRYFVANRSHVDNPQFTAGRDEISARFYEGAAAGAVMIGEAPQTDEFRRQFDWMDAVIHLPFDNPHIAEAIEDFNREPDRIKSAHRRNVREAALRHDWVYRIKSVYDILGLRYTQSMEDRVGQLSEIAARYV